MLEEAFSCHESHREASVEFKRPGPSPWVGAQTWAQLAVDRATGEALAPYTEELVSEPETDHLSFALGVALGRYGENYEGICNQSLDNNSTTLPAGICFLDGSLEKIAAGDSLGHAAANLLHTKWSEHCRSVDATTDLRTWLRIKFFGDVHKDMFENRPIYFLSLIHI